jgi:nucleoside-diphosphate-sugar epimerase
VRTVVRHGTVDRRGVSDRVTVPDVTAEAELTAAFRGVDAVVHLAGMAHRIGVPPEVLAAEYHRVNVTGTEAVVRAAAATGVRRVLVASSVKAVGEASAVPWTESTPPAPTDPYGRSKLVAEQAALRLAASLNVEVVIVRFPLVYGPEAPANVLRLLRLVHRGVPLPLGAVRNRRSMLFLGNLASAVDGLLLAPALGGRTFFVADGVDLSTPDLIRCIAKGLGRPARLVPVPVAALRLAGRLGDFLNRLTRVPLTTADVERLTGSLQVSIEALRSATGYAPPFTPEAGWRATAEWYRTRVT